MHEHAEAHNVPPALLCSGCDPLVSAQGYNTRWLDRRMPIKNRQIDVEVLSEMRFAPCDATLIADDTCDRATEPGFRRKPEANKLSERRQVAQSPAR